MGRPIEYREEIVEKVKEYLALCTDTEPTQENGKKLKVKIPTIEGLANYLDINKDTVYDWSSKYEIFSDVISKLRQEQADRLINNGLAGTYNPTIAKVLMTKHGYREGTDITTNDKDITPDAEARAKADKAIELYLNANKGDTTKQ